MKQRGQLLLLLLFVTLTGNSQSIKGVWHSATGSRTFLITDAVSNKTILLKSSVQSDKPGKIIIERLEQKGRKYKGIINTPGEGGSTGVIVKYKQAKDVLVLRLKRMMILDVRIKWYRNKTRQEQNS